MSDLIDREVAISAFAACPNCHGDGFTVQATTPFGEAEQVQCECSAILTAIRSLPAAVPVVDVEKAGEIVDALLEAASDGRCVEDDWPQRILSAGYVGSVSVEDVRLVANQALRLCEETEPGGFPVTERAAKRLLAATEA